MSGEPRVILTGMLAGALMVILVWVATLTPPLITLDQCRAANPGYECAHGYVKWRAFGE